MKKITTRDIENPQRFVGEGLGAPEAKIRKSTLEAKVQQSIDCIHCFSWKNKKGKISWQWLSYRRTGNYFTKSKRHHLRILPKWPKNLHFLWYLQVNYINNKKIMEIYKMKNQRFLVFTGVNKWN